jgi:hypothetical protein
LPVVVIYHGGPGANSKDSFFYTNLAEKLAENGAVVFVPNWASTRAITDPEEAYRWTLVEMDAGACAVSYAVEKASEYGGDPANLVLFGHSAGAMAASVIGLRDPDPFPDCSVEMEPFEPDRLVLYEGDWLLEDFFWDVFEEGIPTVRAAITPWTWLDTDPKPPVTHVVTAEAVEGGRCGVESEGWYEWRDPDGWFSSLLEADGAFDDDCITVQEATKVLSDTMIEEGYEIEDLFLPDSDHGMQSPEDLDTLVEAILAEIQP